MLTICPLTLGPLEITLVIAVILLLMGGKKIPELMRGIGKGIRNFRHGMDDDVDDQPNQAEKDDK